MDTPTEDQVLEEIRRLAAVELEIAHPIEADHHLLEDLRLDSLGLTVVAVGLEDRFRIKLTEEDSAQISTVRDLARVVAERARGTTR